MNRGCAYVLLLAIFALGASPAKPPVGFVDLARLVAAHPLHSVLAEYDREIAGLRSTQDLPGLRDPAQSARNASAAAQTQTSRARAVVATIGARNSESDRQRERDGVARVRASQDAAVTAMNGYASALERETGANLAAFESATAQRTARAYAARAQQLREKEATLAFDLQRQDAGKRLPLQVKLNDLRLLAPERVKLRAQLEALDARELQAVSAQRRRDAATLAAYRLQLANGGAAANADMSAQLRAKAAANFADRRRVWQSGAHIEGRDALAKRLASFNASYSRGADAAAIDSALRGASADVSQDFMALAAADRQSQREVAAQLATLQGDRVALYRSIVAQILHAAAYVARQRGLAGIDFAGKRPKSSVDLTAAVSAELIR